MACTICGSDYDLIDHHVSYQPEEVVVVCRPCHTKIHADTGFRSDLLPDRVPPERQRNRGTKTVLLDGVTGDHLIGYMMLNDLENPNEAVADLLSDYDAEELDLEVYKARAARIREKMDDA